MTATRTVRRQRFVLRAEDAAGLMTPNPVSLAAETLVREAAAVLTDKEISVAPIIDEAGRPVGVLSHTDIVRHERHKSTYLPRDVKKFDEAERTLSTGEHLPGGFQIELTDATRVREIMTPTVLAVPMDAPISRVLADFLAFKVHHLFVVDDDGVLVGVISAFDILRYLKPA